MKYAEICGDFMLGIIFDFNGTMLFDEDFQDKSWRKFLKNKTGHFISNEEFQECVHGRNAEITLSHFLGCTFSREEIVNLEEEKEAIYRKLCIESPDFKLAEGLPEFLDELVKKEVPITIATASGLNNLKFFFQHLHLDRWFSCSKVVFNDGTIKGKPEPDLYLKAAQKIGINIRNCIIFEDSSSGIESAKRAFANKIIGVASMQSREKLMELGVTDIVEDYSDMRRLLNIIGLQR
jgi:beta-phosphoglucomutase-like phosphatase (HAD superfamily)